MGAKFGSPEGDELDVLTTLVCAYEEKHFPMDPPDPLMAIQFRMEQQGADAQGPGADDREPGAGVGGG